MNNHNNVHNHLEKSKKVIEQWPEWKRQAMDATARPINGNESAPQTRKK